MSDSSPVEEHQSNTGEGNNAGSSAGQSKNNDSLVRTVKFNLSGDRCENYFKNNLRGDGQAVHREHKPYTAEKRAKKLFDERIDRANVFDSDQQPDKTKTLEYKKQVHYQNGALKTNVEFFPWAQQDNTPKKRGLKPKEEIGKTLPPYAIAQPQKPTQATNLRVKDNYNKDIFKDDPREFNPTRAAIIEAYLGSDGVRTAVLKKNSEKQGLPDKVTNVPKNHVNNIIAARDPPKLINTARHIVAGNQVVYQ